MNPHVSGVILLTFLIVSALTSFLVGNENVFYADKLAKQAGFLAAGAVFGFVLLLWPKILVVKLSSLMLVVSFLLSYAGIGILNENPTNFILIEILQFCWVFIIAYLAASVDCRPGSKIYSYILLLGFLSAAFVILGVKLQFAYAGFIPLCFFIAGYRPATIVGFVFFVFLIIGGIAGSLLGKSVAVFLGLTYLVLFRLRDLVSLRFWILGVISICVVFAVTLYASDFIQSTGLYQKTVGFLRFDFRYGVFDVSTQQRLYEASQVYEAVTSSVRSVVFGQGLGGFVDLSYAEDNAVAIMHATLSKVRNIHFLIYLLILKFGVIFTVVVYGFLFRYVFQARRYLNRNGSRSFEIVTTKVLILYSLFLIFDSQFSAGHLISNPLALFSVTLTWRVMRGQADIGHGARDVLAPKGFGV